MNLHLRRVLRVEKFTLGELSIDYGDGRGELPFGFTCEDTDRGLDTADVLAHISSVKVPSATAIPTGRYRVKATWSPKYQRMMPLVCDVPGWKGIRIHSGNDADDSSGCILVGTVQTATGVAHSKVACEWLYKEIAKVEATGGEVWLEITVRVEKTQGP